MILKETIDVQLPQAESKVRHQHPVWFLDGNPIVGFSLQKKGIRLIFGSGEGFDEPELILRGGKFKDASIFYNSIEEIHKEDIERWFGKAERVQWDYKNLA